MTVKAEKQKARSFPLGLILPFDLFSQKILFKFARSQPRFLLEKANEIAYVIETAF
jgi:hypothetical protein